MRIDRLTVTNFKCFEHRSFDLHRQLTLFVGDNGSGKTTILDALAVAAGSWFLGAPGLGTRQLRRPEARVSAESDAEGFYSWEVHYPCAVQAEGEVLGKRLNWRRELRGWPGRTTQSEAKALKALAEETFNAAREGKGTLPLISYYGVCRLCDSPRERAIVKDERPLTDKHAMSRLAGYERAIDPRLSVARFVTWVARQTWGSFQRGGERSPLYQAVIKAVASCIPDTESIHFDPIVGEVVIGLGKRGLQPFNNLSDGQRSMLALVADIATKAATLNPHLGDAALTETPGIVLIDELDLHLHPKWQRRVASDLKRTFPALQFVCTTHSPQVVGELSRDEVRLLRDGEARLPPVARGTDSNWILDHVMEGAASENVEARKLTDALEDALDAGDLPTARSKATELRRFIDGDTGELVRLESYLRRLERLAEHPEDED